MRTFRSLLLLVPVVLLLSSCLVGRFLVYNFADIKDHKKFPSRPLQPASKPFHFVRHPDPINPKLFMYDSDTGTRLNKYLENTGTVAFLIIQKDTLMAEYYYHGYDSASVVPSFSIAKSFTSALIGFAIAEGLIGSVDDPVLKYIPEWNGRGLDKVTIRHLLQMTSGIRFNESYWNPFGDAAKYYYGRNLRKYLVQIKPEKAPGTNWNYVSGNTQMLGLILERVLKGKTVTDYLQEKIWTPIGMEFPASWSLDRKKGGLEKTFCCLNARAYDYAKFGRLYLRKGNWEGKQLLPEDWVVQSTKPDKSVGGVSFYQNQFWIEGNKGDFYAEGILGQFVYVCPETETIIVRLGKKEGKVNWSRLMNVMARMKRP